MAIQDLTMAVKASNGIEAEIRDRAYFMPESWVPPPKRSARQSDDEQRQVLNTYKR